MTPVDPEKGRGGEDKASPAREKAQEMRMEREKCSVVGEPRFRVCRPRLLQYVKRDRTSPLTKLCIARGGGIIDGEAPHQLGFLDTYCM